MADRVVVLGAGYAGASAISAFERIVGSSSAERPNGSDNVELVWISDRDYHLVLHEVHRAIRDPSVREHIAIPVEDVKAPSTTFVEAEVTGIDAAARRVELADRDSVDYDYLIVALGSDTAFYGIPGLAEHAHTLNGLDDALAIHEALATGSSNATADSPYRVVIGGAGLSGVQAAGEVVQYGEETSLPVQVTLVEALDDILPGADPELRTAVDDLLKKKGVEVLAGDPITEADHERIHFDEGDPLGYDLLVWTGGITGREALEGAGVETNHDRVVADTTFATSDDRVFAVGDAAALDAPEGKVPPTAQAAWSAGDVAAQNVVHAIEGRPLEAWTYEDKGTVLSVGEAAVAHDVVHVPIETFDSFPARALKKFIAARWIADVTSWPRALRAWGAL